MSNNSLRENFSLLAKRSSRQQMLSEKTEYSIHNYDTLRLILNTKFQLTWYTIELFLS